MIVYVIMEHWDYDGDEVFAVLEDKKKAKAAFKERCEHKLAASGVSLTAFNTKTGNPQKRGSASWRRHRR